MDENVSVIVVGQETRFLQYYSNQYSAIKQNIEEMKCGGPSPLTAAFLLALGGLFEGAAYTRKIGDFLLHPRVVLFTDGRLTDFRDSYATDTEGDLIPNDHILAPLFSVIHQIGRDHPIFCFPVGENPNYPLLQTISGVSKGGKVLGVYEAECFGRYTLHYHSADLITKATNKTDIEREHLRSVAESILLWQTYDEDDLDTIYELIRNKERIMETQERVEDDDEKLHKEKYSTIPRLGTRVRRGPHWTFQNQDSEGIGTIVGHGDKAGLVLVEWDNGHRSLYNYGIRNLYDIVVCDEPRIPLDGFVAVGCFVKRGPDWNWGDQDGGAEAIGTCYRVMDNATVYVRWPCGRMGNYRFGYDGKYDIEPCDPFSPDVMKAVREQRDASMKSDTDTEHKLTSNDLKGYSEIQSTPHNTTEQSIMREVNGNLSWRNTISNQGRSTVLREATDTESTKQLYEQIIQREQVTCNDRRNVTNIQTENFPMTISDEDLETDEGHNIGLEGNSVERISRSSKDIDRSASPDEYHNPLSVNSSVIVKNCVSGKGKSSINASTILSNNKITYKNPDLCVAGINKDTVQIETYAEMESNVAMTSQNHTTNHFYLNLANRNLSWQWQDNTGVWVDYSEHVNNLINYRLRQRPMATVLISNNDESFRIVASKMIQINTKTKERHNIRCRNT
ncbi:uncharacterized protein LOC133181906 [Saccostrea echinata]|uniref:uncharacterized protein LOC133181906 n=1 Tax=Saccostrea echinata TaxID=191078 RepID=UPI002A7EDB5A|nr:uncharacterized protein LOC133181906 [Saccostrea echinata]